MLKKYLTVGVGALLIGVIVGAFGYAKIFSVKKETSTGNSAASGVRIVERVVYRDFEGELPAKTKYVRNRDSAGRAESNVPVYVDDLSIDENNFEKISYADSVFKEANNAKVHVEYFHKRDLFKIGLIIPERTIATENSIVTTVTEYPAYEIGGGFRVHLAESKVMVDPYVLVCGTRKIWFMAGSLEMRGYVINRGGVWSLIPEVYTTIKIGL